MNKYFKKSTKRSVISMLSIAITLCLLFSLLFPGKAVNAAPRLRLNKTAVTLIQGKTVKLRVIGTKRKVTWKSSNKKIAKVNKKGVVKALSPGKCTITAKVRGKKLKCKVTVDTVERINAKKLYDLIRKKGKKGKGEEKIQEQFLQSSVLKAQMILLKSVLLPTRKKESSFLAMITF